MVNTPPTVPQGTVTGRFLLTYADGSDVGSVVDWAAAKGTVLFTPSAAYLKHTPTGTTFLPATVECQLDSEGYLVGPDSQRGVKLLSSAYNEDIQPTDWTWRVDFRLTDQSDIATRGISSFSFTLPEGSIDLTTVAPVPDSGGVFYLVGPTGPIGPEGPSAYEIAVENGFTGTESEWVASLTGPQGPQGIQGVPGSSTGDSAYTVAVQNGFIGTEAEWLASLVGEQGPAGADGADGTNGTNGLDGATGPQGPAGATGATGPTGPTGATGATGAQGVAGLSRGDYTNFFLNGSFKIWQRGNSVLVSSGSSAYTADRWRVTSDTNWSSPAASAITASLNSTGSGLKTSGTGASNISYRLSASQVEDMLAEYAATPEFYEGTANPITLNMDVYDADDVRLAIDQIYISVRYIQDDLVNGTDQRDNWATGTIMGTQYHVLTENEGLFDNETYRWLRVNILDFGDPAYWGNGLEISVGRRAAVASGTQPTVNTLYNNARLNFVPGDVAYTSKYLNEQFELDACKHYFMRMKNTASAVGYFPAFQTSTTSSTAILVLPQTMRKVPAVTSSSIQMSDGTTALAVSGVAVKAGSTAQNLHLTITHASGGAAFRPGYIRSSGTTGYIDFNAEL